MEADSLALSREVVAARGDVMVTFRVSEALNADPDVHFAWTGSSENEGRAELVARDEATRGYTYEFIAPDLADGEMLASLLVEMADTAGNPGRAEFARILAFDFTDPTVVPGTTALQLFPADDNPLLEVTTATVGTTIVVSMVMSEPLLEPPALGASSPDDLELAMDSAFGTTYVFSTTVSSAALAQGTYDLQWTATDLAGNTQSGSLDLPAPGLVVDTTMPPAPDVDSTDRIVFTRIPWGNAGTQGAKRFALRGGAGAVAAGATVLVLDGPDADAAGEIARTRADEGGAFGAAFTSPDRFEVGGVDRTALYVVAVDDAGNRSDADLSTPGIQATRVRDIEWVATLGDKRPGQSLGNPHSAWSSAWFANTLLPRHTSPELGSGDGIAEVGGEHESTRGAGRWYRKQPSLFGGSGRVSAAVDAARGRLVVFGGSPPATWEWDGLLWYPITPSDPEGDGEPAATVCEGVADLNAGPMVYAADSGRTVLYAPSSGGLWEWDGASWAYRAPAEPATHPGNRCGYSLVFDSTHNRIIMHGGLVDDGSVWTADNSTWTWSAGAWTRVSESGPARAFSASAFDPVRGLLLLHGGCHAGCSNQTVFDGDSWEWNGQTWQPAGTPGPSPRMAASMAYDRRRRALVIAGGCADGMLKGQGCFSVLDDVWQYDAAGWSALTTEPDALRPAVAYHNLFFHDVLERLVLASGGSLVELDGATWRPLGVGDAEADGYPEGPRYGHILVEDPDDRSLRLYGGSRGAEYLHDDYWRWDGVSWSSQGYTFYTPPNPVGRFGPLRGAFAPDRGALVLYGGGDATDTWETWEWSFSTGWRCMQTNCVGAGCGATCTQAPGPLYLSEFASSFDGQRIIVVGGSEVSTSVCNGGSACDRTWGWDSWGQVTCGAGRSYCWKELTPATSPPPRGSTAMTYDSDRGVVVLFSGNCPSTCNDTWEWNGNTWTDVTGAGEQPGQRHGHFMAYDPRKQLVLLLGGSSFVGIENVSWAFDGSTWRRLPVVDPEGDGAPGLADAAPMAFHEASQELLMSNGSGQMMWGYDSARDRKPAHIANFHLAAADVAGDEHRPRHQAWPL